MSGLWKAAETGNHRAANLCGVQSLTGSGDTGACTADDCLPRPVQIREPHFLDASKNRFHRVGIRS